MEGWRQCWLVGKCMKDNTEVQKVLWNINRDDCHAKAEVEYKRCGNGEENPITATKFLGFGLSSSKSYPKSKGSRTWTQTKHYPLIFKEIAIETDPQS